MVDRRPFKGELWCVPQIAANVIVNVLMPNGLILEISCCREDSLEKIKQSAWNRAEKEILFRLLGDITCYVFIGVTQDAKVEEFYDENRRLCDLNLFTTLLKLIEAQGDKEEKKADSETSMAIGVSLPELENHSDNEVHNFRREITAFCKNVVEERENASIDDKLYYVHQPLLDEASLYDSESHVNDTLQVCVWFIECAIKKINPSSLCTDKRSAQIDVPCNATSGEVIIQSLKKLSDIDATLSCRDADKIESTGSDFVLKACGIEEYLLGNHPLCQYRYITSCLSQKKVPQLMLKPKEDLLSLIEKSQFRVPTSIKRSPSFPSLDTKQSHLSNPQSLLWTNEDAFKIQILWATFVNVHDAATIFVRAGLYHGGQLLCPPKATNPVDPWSPRWDQEIEFAINTADLPRSARLCVSICSSYERKTKQGDHPSFPLAYGNLPVIDYTSRLLTGRKTIHLWQFPKDVDELLNPHGVLGSNVNKFSTGLEIEFKTHKNSLYYPPIEHILPFGQHSRDLDFEGKEFGTYGYDEARYQKYKKVDEKDLNSLQNLIKRDPISPLTTQEKNLLWRLREHCLTIPESLPRLLNSICWNCREDVAQLYLLISKWPPLKSDTALQLLDCDYADPFVRNFAIKWLDKNLSDELLSQYLLQLVQVMKYEPYLDNGLSRMLLKRALLNRQIGHFFFWHLKSEMHEPFVKIRFCLLLESYCRGISPTILRSTLRQVEALDKLTILSEALKQKKDDNREKIKLFSEQIEKDDYLEALQNFPSPLNYTMILGKLELHQCRIMDSAKKPLWLVWSNPDPLAELYCSQSAIIFKSGDDLRQDMLTLQVIRIFDLIWRREGYDLRMLPYSCLATGKQVGMIEVVPRAKTVMSIQRTGGKMAAFQVDSTQLHRWIKENNPDNYDQAIDTFTNSCAGYCVATFILGIGDRNPDNIMVNEEGQIFHIDFGHFLGHFKKKFGINRERVPFVLTDDFLFVISKGSEYPKKSKEFEEFTKLCGSAYLSLRKHANLLITLFTIMLSTGIPELKSLEDIGYLRKTLQVDKSEEKALKYFNNQFFEAHGGAWTTKIDWFFHNIAHFKN